MRRVHLTSTSALQCGGRCSLAPSSRVSLLPEDRAWKWSAALCEPCRGPMTAASSRLCLGRWERQAPCRYPFQYRHHPIQHRQVHKSSPEEAPTCLRLESVGCGELDAHLRRNQVNASKWSMRKSKSVTGIVCTTMCVCVCVCVCVLAFCVYVNSMSLRTLQQHST